MLLSVIPVCFVSGSHCVTSYVTYDLELKSLDGSYRNGYSPPHKGEGAHVHRVMCNSTL